MFIHKFTEMYNWYLDNINQPSLFEEQKDVALFIIKQSKKYTRLSKNQIKKRKLQTLSNKNDKYLGAFFRTNIVDIAKFKFATSHNYPNGLYCVLDDENIYAVFPTEKQQRLFADHLTFMAGNVHLTTYTPQPLTTDYGVVSHIPKCNVPDGTQLPLDGYNCQVFNRLSTYKNDILDIYRVPYVIMSGGGKSFISKKTKRKRPEISPILEQLLLRENIAEVKVFCIRHGNEWHVTTNSIWNERSQENEDGSFVVKSNKWACVQRGLITHLLRGYI
jgi:hypothetical protein